MKTPLQAVIAFALAVLSLGIGAHASPVVQNPSFEAVQIGSPFRSSNAADVPDWTHTGPVGDALLWAVGYSDGGGSITVAGDGNQFVTMGGGFNTPGTSAWSQSISGFTPLQPYVLTFKMASETSDSQAITVSFPAGSATPAQTFTAAPSTANYWRNWETKSLTFIPNSSSVTLQFGVTQQTDDVGLDAVSIAAVPSGLPLPSSVWGGLVLLAGLGAWTARRRMMPSTR